MRRVPKVTDTGPGSWPSAMPSNTKISLGRAEGIWTVSSVTSLSHSGIPGFSLTGSGGKERSNRIMIGSTSNRILTSPERPRSRISLIARSPPPRLSAITRVANRPFFMMLPSAWIASVITSSEASETGGVSPRLSNRPLRSSLTTCLLRPSASARTASIASRKTALRRRRCSHMSYRLLDGMVHISESQVACVSGRISDWPATADLAPSLPQPQRRLCAFSSRGAAGSPLYTFSLRWAVNRSGPPMPGTVPRRGASHSTTATIF